MRAVRWALLAAVTLTCVGLGYGAYTLAGISWNAVVDYKTPYSAMTLPETPAGTAEASRTVVLIVDGLRLDASREMGSLNNLRTYGADLALTAPQPSLSYPNWTTVLSGAPPYVSGVVTNWHEGQAPVETIFDTAKRAGIKTVFVGPEDFETLYGVEEKTTASFMLKWEEEYLSDRYVDAALELTAKHNPQLLVVHLPDVDEAGHRSGGASQDYADTVEKIDVDLSRLVDGLQDSNTVFAVVADHGHIDTGGHGGWESEVVRVPGVVAGPGVRLATAEANQVDFAPTVAVLAGIPVPRYAMGRSLAGTEQGAGKRQEAFATQYADIVAPDAASDTALPSENIMLANEVRLAQDQQSRVPWGLAVAGAALVVFALVWLASTEAFLAALSGTAAYYLVYNSLFFLIHRYAWSLSAFNSEDLIESWMNMRLVEAGISMLVGAAVAGAVYPLLRKSPKGPSGRYLAGWLTLGPTTALVLLATLAVQVAWFVWAWGVIPVWRLPDLRWGFKYDLDLIQATAIGFAAVLTPLVTYVVGRYHPKLRGAQANAGASAKKT